ncbi:hypothetical protein WR25_00065 [Diploscapter pachys]|uniref:Apple domain-containing protein n=1 Tax=Diploscapter pachys TaxID=2018661 RepID=A0A2A2KEI4_9BILA|nr:hypothetical protein WR25_00065 [Diploscapter pachys]
MVFAASELEDLSTRFEADAVAFSVQHCARICYETACLQAAFTRFPRPLCLLHYSNSTEEDPVCNSTAERVDGWHFTKLNQVVRLSCLTCEKDGTTESPMQARRLGAVAFSQDEPSDAPLHEGLSSKCDGGRVEFQIIPVASLPKLNISNDVPATTPADCARKCFEAEKCTTAGFIPSPSGDISHGVCLLTSDESVCGNQADFVSQHAAIHPFVISCIQCTSCVYNMRTATPEAKLPEFKGHEEAKSAQECARMCADKKCTMAKWNSGTKTCSFSYEESSGSCSKEVALVTDGILPVTLDCVQCAQS